MRRFIAMLLAACAVMLGLVAFQPVALAEPSRATGVPLSGISFNHPEVCVTDLTYGYYPAVIETVSNQLRNGTDMHVTYTNSDLSCNTYWEQYQIIRWTLIPAANSNQFNWCAKVDDNSYRNQYGTWQNKVQVYYNYYHAGCHENTTYIKMVISRMMGLIVGLGAFNGGTYYSVMNVDRENIPYLTSNDLIAVSSIPQY